MKSYLNFSLTGKKFLPLWLLFIVLYIVPYIFLIWGFTKYNLKEGEGYFLIPAALAVFIIVLVLGFFLTKLFISGFQYKETNVEFKGNVGEYLGLVLLGLLLSIITLGIYIPWFITKIQRFYIGRTSYKDENFTFMSKGWQLLLIYVFAALLPMIIINSAIQTGIFFLHFPDEVSGISSLLSSIVMTPYIYLVYKWIVNISYKNYVISWRTEFFSSVGYILGQVLLSIITIGIYGPMAALRIYRYFALRTYAVSEEKSLKFGFEKPTAGDFFFIWAQILLTLLTLSFYFPWSYCGITRRVLTKTYTEVAE